MQLTCIKEGNNSFVFLAKGKYRTASVKNNEKFFAFYFKLSQYFIHSVQNNQSINQIYFTRKFKYWSKTAKDQLVTYLNNTAINIATAVKWMAINEKCLIRESKLLTRTLIHFCLATSASSTIKKIFCREVIF